jgi:hypothetical protein
MNAAHFTFAMTGCFGGYSRRGRQGQQVVQSSLRDGRRSPICRRRNSTDLAQLEESCRAYGSQFFEAVRRATPHAGMSGRDRVAVLLPLLGGERRILLHRSDVQI